MRRVKSFTRVLAVVSVALLGTATAFAEHRRLSPELNDKVANPATSAPASTENGSQVDVIIQFKPGAKLSDGITKVIGAGGQHKSRFDVINGGLFRVPVSLLPTLAEDPAVAYISLDRQTIKLGRLDMIMDATKTTSIINLGYTGIGIGVAVIDSGVSNHADLRDNSTSTASCFSPWSSGQVYTAGLTASYNGINYTANFWTQNQNPANNSGVSGSGQPWTSNGSCVGRSRVVYSESFVPGLDASDQYGHGTHVAGLIASNGSTSGQWMIGVASRVNIINLRVLDANGAGTDSQVISAIQRAIQLKNNYNIRVINLSLGRRIFESYNLDPLCQAVEQAWKAGIVVVVAAGNYGRDNSMNTNGYATITAPGNDPYVITVGAFNTHATDTTADDTMTSYSSKGPTLIDHVVKPDLVAPGNRLVSLLASGSTLDRQFPQDELSPSLYGSYGSSSYVYMSGTSMAAPMVSGAAALMLEYIPSLTPDQVKARLMKTAIKSYPSYSTAQSSSGTSYNMQYDIFTVGAGFLDTYDAMAISGTPTGTALSPIAYRDSSGNVRIQTDPTSIWSNLNSSIWGGSVVWGDSVLLNGTSICWGDSVVWGDNTLLGNSVVWGTSVVWGDSTTYSEAGDYDKN